MTSPHDQPQSRRDARRALEAELAGIESVGQPFDDRRSGRGSATPSSGPSSAPTELTYRTQVRPRMPQYDERTVSPAVEQPARGVPVPPPTPPVAPPAFSEHAAERIRRRDFRPPAVADEPPSHAAGPTFDSPLDHHSQFSPRAHAPVAPAPAPQAHVITVPGAATDAHAEPLVERTLSRRELRELRAAQEPVVETVRDIVVPADLTTPPPAAAPTLVEPAWSEPARHEPAQNAPLHVETGRAEPEQTQPAPVRQLSVVSPSTGSHWSTGLHDDEDPFENTFSREVGSATSLNTNALVLPEMPTGSIAGPVAGTGEIIITGMIAVSPLHASTGTVPAVHDSPDLDDLFDVNDREVTAPDSAPVSALKAISSHAATHTVLTGKRSTSNTITTVLVATTVGMAVVAIGLFVVAAANGLF